MGDLTKHFSASEFASHDGAETPLAVRDKLYQTALMLEELRAALGDEPIRVLSGYRSPKHNKAVGGAKNSYHLRGMAADISVKTKTPREVQRTALKLQKEGVIGGVGKYPGFTHVDWGPRRTWSEEG